MTKILIADAEDAAADRLRALLDDPDYQVIGRATTGEEAIRLCRQTPPGIVLMDVSLPGAIQGADAAQRIRREQEIPVVLITSDSDLASLQPTVQPGWSGYLTKPVGADSLRAVIATTLFRESTERRLRQMERWLARTLESIGDAVIATDAAGRITFMNAVAERLTGWAQHEANGQPLHDVFRIVSGVDPEWKVDLLKKTLEQGLSIRLDDGHLLIRRDQRMIPIDDSATPIRSPEGKTSGVVLIFRDSSERVSQESERRRLERWLFDSEKLESLGAMASGVGHDINNLLTSVLANANLCRKALPSDSPLHAHLQPIEEAGRRAGDLCLRLLAYAGESGPDLRAADLGLLLQEQAASLRLNLPGNVELKVEGLADLPPVRADANQLRQVVNELAGNAIEALGGRPGQVLLFAGSIRFSEEQREAAIQPCELAVGEHACLEISDNGCGMSPTTLARVFDPFFTTKKSRRGMGLAVVHGIVRQHQGALLVRTQVGEGTSVRVILPFEPRPEPASVKAPANSDASQVPAAGGTVLLADDEELLRRVGIGALAQRGFTAVTARDGEEALSIFRQSPDRICAIVLDVTMPKMDGLRTLEEIRRIRPNVPAVLMSGFPGDSLRRALGAGTTAFLQKPFDIDAFWRAFDASIAKAPRGN
ncbi:MAG: response regulator [Verrucomicrobiales bacterium]|nr:response regulator [Verrucomicrobiales bacterium]